MIRPAMGVILERMTQLTEVSHPKCSPVPAVLYMLTASQQS